MRIWLLLVFALALPPAPAAAGALDDCRPQVDSPAQLTRCLTAARQHAADQMLDAFLALRARLIQEAGDGEDGPRAAAATAALRESQRDFERLLQSSCEIAQRFLPGELLPTQALLACEADHLRARRAALQALSEPAGTYH